MKMSQRNLYNNICGICGEAIFNKRKHSNYCSDCYNIRREITIKLMNTLNIFKLKYPAMKISFRIFIKLK